MTPSRVQGLGPRYQGMTYTGAREQKGNTEKLTITDILPDD